METILFLLVVSFILIFVNMKALKREGKSFDTAFNNAKVNTDEVDIKIAELRREFSETILELQLEIQSLKEVKDKDEKDEKIVMDNIKNNTNSAVKINEVDELIKSGYSVDEISKKLGIGKGEVLLIKELYLK